MWPRWWLLACSRADARIASPCNRVRNVVRMPPQIQADSGRVRRPAEDDKPNNRASEPWRNKGLGMAGSFTVSCMSPLVSPLQDPVRPVRQIKAGGTSIFGIEPAATALSARAVPLHPAARPTTC